MDKLKSGTDFFSTLNYFLVLAYERLTASKVTHLCNSTT
jgi:hypothetical protein